MKKLLLHLIAAGAAAGLGWLAGAPAGGASSPQPLRRNHSAKSSPATRSETRSAWEQQIAAVRRVPGARAENAWIKWCFAIPDADVPASIAKLNPYSDFHALRCLYARWARLDPAAAWASFRQSAIPDTVSHFYLHEDENRRTSGLVQSSLGTSPRSLIASRMLASIESKDPAAAKALAAKLRAAGSDDAKDVPVKSYLLGETDRLLGKNDDDDNALPPAQAAAAAAALTDASGKGKALESAARRWLQSDPAAACAWLQQLPPEERNGFTLVNLEWSLNHATPADRTKTLYTLLEARGVSTEEIERAGREGRTGMPWGSNDSIANAANAAATWAGQDPSAARDWLTTLPDGNTKAALAGTIVGALVRTDVNGAIGLLNNTGGDQSVAVGSLMRGWLETDARAALEWAGKIDDAPLRDTSRTTAALQLAGTDPALAIETARAVTDPTLRQSVFQEVQDSLSWNPAALRALQEKFPGDDWNAPKR